LRNEHELRSESAGSGPFRHVVIYPAGMPSLPDPPPQPDRYQRTNERDRRPRGGDRRPGGPGGNDRRPPRGRR
jgi:hypothetical protein